MGKTIEYDLCLIRSWLGDIRLHERVWAGAEHAERKQSRGNDGCLKLDALAISTDVLAILMAAALPRGAII